MARRGLSGLWDEADLLALWVVHNALEGRETDYGYRWRGHILRFQIGKAVREYIRERRRLGLPCKLRYRALLTLLQGKAYCLESAPTTFGTAYGLWCDGIDTTAEELDIPRKEVVHE